MNVHDAIRLINDGSVTYRPGWTFTATSHTNRFEGTIGLRIDYVAPDTDVSWAPGYEKIINTYANFAIQLMPEDTENDLYLKVQCAVLRVEEHESREFFAVSGNEYRKPFHPHTVEGMTRWQNHTGRSMVDDLMFGVI